jgi:uncharacterized protein (TIGR03382 family)
MKSSFKLGLSTVAAAAAMLLAPLSAQALVLDFEDLPTTSGFFLDAPVNGQYKGFDFSNSTGSTGVEWFWDAGAAPYYANGTTNAGGTGAVGFYEYLTISSATPFTFQGAFFSGCCGPIGIELVDVDGNITRLGQFGLTGTGGFGNPGLPSDGGTFDLTLDGTPGLSGGNTYSFINSVAPNLVLREVAIYGELAYFAVDDIEVTPVPEPSAVTLALASLGGLVWVSRRRKQGIQAA